MRTLSLLLFLLSGLAACGDGSAPTPAKSGNSSAANKEQTGLSEAWRGLEVREFRTGSAGREMVVIDVLPAESSTGLILGVTLRAGDAIALERERSPAEAQKAQGGWLLEVPQNALDGASDARLSLELRDDTGTRFVVYPK